MRLGANLATMTQPAPHHLAPLPDRTAIAVEGPDRVAFLQGLVSNDVAAAAPGRAVWAALLSPQGKWLADFFIFSDADRLLLDCERAQAPMLVQRLSRFRLRAAVTIAPCAALAVYVAWNATPAAPEGALLAPDPRLPDAGWRLLSPTPLLATAAAEDWDLHRLALGLPDGSRDLEADKTVLLEAGFDELNGVSWTKGCYMGQELTARTRYRGLLKRRLVPVSAEAALPPPGTSVLRADGPEAGAEVGTLRSSRDGIGLAVLRLDALHAPLLCGGLSLTPRILGWMRLPETVA